jgi:hypothetical protein
VILSAAKKPGSLLTPVGALDAIDTNGRLRWELPMVSEAELPRSRWRSGRIEPGHF